MKQCDKPANQSALWWWQRDEPPWWYVPLALISLLVSVPYAIYDLFQHIRWVP